MAQFIYQSICHQVIKAINDGILQHGDKLDSVRSLAKKRNIGLSTAVQVYRELEKQGWVHAEPKKGYFVKQPTNVSSHSYGRSFIRSKNLNLLPFASAVQYSLSTPDVLSLSCTAPSTVVDSELLLNKFHRKALTARPYQLKIQEPIESSSGLRGEIAKHFLKSGQVIHPDEILITNGRIDGLSIALQACKLFGGKVAIEAPSSFFFRAVLQQFKIDVVAIPMQSDFEQELKLLDEAHQQEAFSAYLFNPNFNDPTGRLLSVNEKLSLIKWAEKSGIILIEYDRGELYFDNGRPPSIASLLSPSSKVKVISIADFYDTVSDRLALGYIVCKNSYQECLFSKQVATEEPMIAVQSVVLELFQSGQYQKLLNQIRSRLRQQKIWMTRILKELLGELLYISDPCGGPCLWLALPEEKSSRTLWENLLKKKIAIAPGCLFLKAGSFENYFRVTFALPWNDEMEREINVLAEVIKSYVES